MSLGSVKVTESLIANGGAAYNITMEYIEGTAGAVMEVQVAGVLQILGIDYNVAENLITRSIGQSFDLTFINVPANLSVIDIARNTDRLQGTTFQDIYDDEVLETRIDKTMMVSQEIDFAQTNVTTTPIGYPPGIQTYARFNENGSALVADTAPMTYLDGALMQIGTVVIKDGKIWESLGDNTQQPAREPFITNTNNFQGEVNLGNWRTVVGQQGETGGQGVQGPQGAQGAQGIQGEEGSERAATIINNDVINTTTNIVMGRDGEETVRMDVEIIRTDDSEERQSYLNLIAMLFGGVWQVKILTSSGFGGNPVGVTFVIQAGTNELLYTSDDMTGTSYIGTMRTFLWRFD